MNVNLLKKLLEKDMQFEEDDVRYIPLVVNIEKNTFGKNSIKLVINYSSENKYANHEILEQDFLYTIKVDILSGIISEISRGCSGQSYHVYIINYDFISNFSDETIKSMIEYLKE